MDLNQVLHGKPANGCASRAWGDCHRSDHPHFPLDHNSAVSPFVFYHKYTPRSKVKRLRPESRRPKNPGSEWEKEQPQCPASQLRAALPSFDPFLSRSRVLGQSIGMGRESLTYSLTPTPLLCVWHRLWECPHPAVHFRSSAMKQMEVQQNSCRL